MSVPPTAKPADPAAITIALPPALLAELPPGEPGAKPLPKPGTAATWRQRFIDKGDKLVHSSGVSFVTDDPEVQNFPPVDKDWLEDITATLNPYLLGFAVARFQRYYHDGNEPAVALVHWLALQHGLGAALDVLLHAARWQQRPGAGTGTGWHPNALWKASRFQMDASPLWQLRGHWLKAPDADCAAANARLRAAWADITFWERVPFLIALPDLGDLATRSWAEATAEQQDSSGPWVRRAVGLPLDAIVRTASQLLANAPLLALLVREHGAALLPMLVDLAAEQRDEALGWALAAYDTPEATAAIARLACKDAKSLKPLTWVCEQRPDAALAPILAVLDEAKLPKGGAQRLTPLLKTLAATLGERLPPRLPTLPASARKLLAPWAGQAAAQDRLAPRERWPAVLAEPPWTRPRPAAQAPLPDLALHPIAPVTSWTEDVRTGLMTEDYVNWGLGWEDLTQAQIQKELPQWTAEAVAHTGQDAAAAQQLASDWQQLMEASEYDNGYRRFELERSTGHMLWVLHTAPAVTVWNLVADRLPNDFPVAGIVARGQLAALPGLVRAFHRDAAQGFVAQYIGAVELAPLMAQTLARKPKRRADVHAWLQRFPDHAAAGLLPLALGDSANAGEARSALRALLSQGDARATAAVRRAAARYGSAEVTAATEALLDQDPVQDFPAKLNARSKLPAFWQTAGWARPRSADGLALPDDALLPLGLMFSFAADRPEGYAGLDAVKAACTPQSLADFAWDACAAWEAAGASAPGNWALRILGQVGTDETARQLGALVRRWSAPGAGGTATRIGWVLDTLSQLGGDVALLQLDAIARKNRLVTVREQAAERLAQAAAAQGWTEDELQDRIVPDLGLDARGSLLLDFGPRQFHVDFDEALAPYVRESVDGRPGARLATAPRARASDDAALAADAVARFKALKDDATTIAAQQPLRLERAMCTGRAWPLADFRRFIAEHPLMRHLAQRLVWGVLAQPEAGGQSVPALQAAFRVSAEGEWTDADDAPWSPPAEGANAGADADALRIVVAHPLQLSAAQIAAFATQFADYELIQPFDQLHRATHALAPDEGALTALARWKGRQVNAGPLWGLESRGWQRGYSDGGVFTDVSRKLRGGQTLSLSFSPGLEQGAGASKPTLQTLGELRASLPIAQTNPIDFSEAVRDLEALGGSGGGR